MNTKTTWRVTKALVAGIAIGYYYRMVFEPIDFGKERTVVNSRKLWNAAFGLRDTVMDHHQFDSARDQTLRWLEQLSNQQPS